MVSVNNNALVDKLHNLNSTQQSIETVSAWCSFYRKDARKVVSIWEQEFVKMPMPKQLAMSYLANDILQNSRKKGPEFVHEFYKTLPRAVKHLLKHGDDKVKRAVNRLVDIWDDRKVFGNSGTRPFREVASEAETPKRAGSGIAQEQAQGVPAKFVPLEALANALSESQTTSDRSNALVQMVLQLDEDMLSTGTQSDLLAAGQLLKQYNGSLQSQLSRHQHAAHILQALLAKQEENVQQVQEQLEGGKQQQLLIQERLNSGAAAAAQQPQPPFMQENSINTHAHPPMPDQGYPDDQAYQNDQDYPHAHDQQANQDDEVDMEFDPPGSAVGPPAEPPFGQRSDAGFGQDGHEEEAQAAGGQGQEPGADELYSPGLSAQPSGSYMSDPGFQGNRVAPAIEAAGASEGVDYAAPPDEGVGPDALSLMQALQALPKEQRDAIGLNLSSVFQQPPAPDPNDFLADQMVNSTKAPEEYDPEELYDPSENM
ncbi:hypothetical protein WJX82_003153 [Trebouxia sp. C0006]